MDRAINTFKLLTFVENWEKFEADPLEAIFYVLAPLAVEALNVAEKWNRDTEREKVRKKPSKDATIELGWRFHRVF